MNRMLRRIAITLALIGLGLLPATTAAAFSTAGSGGGGHPTTTVQVPASATLVPSSLSGPGVTITITYKCLPNGAYYGFADVHVADSTASNDTFFTPTCNDRRQRAPVFVAGAFQAGNGAASALLCGFDCNSAQRSIKIK
jgi:hypothetical protein